MHKLKLNIIAVENPNTAYIPHHHYCNFKTVSKAKERKGALLMPKVVTSSDTGRISIYIIRGSLLLVSSTATRAYHLTSL